jgi:uncharacterized phage protein (TIGR01671 family)
VREHKYRIWDVQNKKMLYFTLGDLLKHYYDSTDYWDFPQDDLAANLDNIDADKAMDFTGLQDKNGRDIYKGDIVLVEGRAVEYVDWGVACFRIISKDGFKMALEDISHLLIEVIGNIYENADLVQKEQ